MANSEMNNYEEEIELLQDEFPDTSREHIENLYARFNGNLDEIQESLSKRENEKDKFEWIENRYAEIIEQILDEDSFAKTLKKNRFLRIVGRCKGDLNEIRFSLLKIQQRSNFSEEMRSNFREKLKQQNSSALLKAGLNVNSVLVLDQLEKYNGNVEKVIEIMQKRQTKKEQYKNQIEQLKARGIDVKNKKLLFQLLEKCQGDLNLFEKLLQERKQTEKSYEKPAKEHFEMNCDDWNHLKELRDGGIHGNPIRILRVFHECQQSIELTRKRLEEENLRRKQNEQNRIEKKLEIVEIDQAFLTLNEVEDWPNDVQRVLIHGENIFPLVKSFRQFCLDGKRNKAEQTLIQIVSEWKKTMKIPSVELIFDSTTNSMEIEQIQVYSSQSSFSNVEEFLLDRIEKNFRTKQQSKTLIVTSDRQLIFQLKRDEFLFVKPFNWLMHCATILSSTTDFDELVDRFSTINF